MKINKQNFLFLCDRKDGACSNPICKEINGYCMHTSNIDHAKYFSENDKLVLHSLEEIFNDRFTVVKVDQDGNYTLIERELN